MQKWSGKLKYFGESCLHGLEIVVKCLQIAEQWLEIVVKCLEIAEEFLLIR